MSGFPGVRRTEIVFVNVGAHRLLDARSGRPTAQISELCRSRAAADTLVRFSWLGHARASRTGQRETTCTTHPLLEGQRCARATRSFGGYADDMLIILSLSVSLAAQTVPPKPAPQQPRIVGKVTDASKKPVANATVVLRSWPIASRTDAGPAHVVRVTTRANGRFGATVLHGRAYSAWAKLPDGTCTEIVDELHGGQHCTLAAETFERRQQSVRVHGLEAWQDRSPFRFRVLTTAQQPDVVVLELDAGGSARLPTLPGRWLAFEVLDKDGNTFFGKDVDQANPGADHTIRVPPPLPMPVHVLDADTGKPVASATVFFRAPGMRQTLCAAGRTREDGKIEVLLPCNQKDVKQTVLHVEARGYVHVVAQLVTGGGQSFYTREQRPGAAPAITLRLPKAGTVRGRVVDRQGKPVGHLSLFTQRIGFVYFARGTAQWLTTQDRLFETGVDGRFEFGGMQPGRTVRLTALPTAAQRTRLVGASDDQGTVLLWHGQTDKRAHDTVLGDIGAHIRRVHIHVRTDEGSVAFARVTITPRVQATVSDAAVRIADRRGTLSLALAPGRYTLVTSSPKLGYRFRDLDLGSDTTAAVELEFVLAKFHFVSGQVVDTAGQPIAGAQIRSTGYSVSGQVSILVHGLNRSLLATTTDALGRFRSPFVPHENYRFQLTAAVLVDGRRHAASPVQVDGHSEDPVVDFTIPVGAEAKKK